MAGGGDDLGDDAQAPDPGETVLAAETVDEIASAAASHRTDNDEVSMEPGQVQVNASSTPKRRLGACGSSGLASQGPPGRSLTANN